MDSTELPPVSRTIAVDVRLTDPRPVGRVQLRHIRMQPSVAAGLHVHNGPVFGNITEGSVIYQIEGAPEQVLRAGDAFYEPEGARVARFDATAEGVAFYGCFLVDADQEPEITFPQP